jgi:hypothetical protein
MQIQNVMFVRPELGRLFEQYYLIRDCLQGETAIKAAGQKYLPMPNATDTGPENKARYHAYKMRAVFYNVARRTMSGLIGQVFMRDPVIKVPAALDDVIKDATGSGIDITQQAKKSVALTLAYSRSGLFVDYPEAPAGGATAEEIKAGNLRPTITSYSPMQIINWRVIEKGAKEIYSLIVLAESFVAQDDGFEMKTALQFRVLRLNPAGEYIQEVWRETNGFSPWAGDQLPKGKSYAVTKTIRPVDSKGEPFKEIPFSFIGSDNNDSSPDNPNFYDLCSINVSHYRNSADYEESCFIVGQPTPVLTGLTEEWYVKILNKTVNFGSRGGIPLPTGADAKLLQAEENTMIKEAMDTKEQQMVALGAKLVEQKQVQKTAFEAKVDATSSASTLSSTAKNVSAAYQWALEWCGVFTGIGETGIEFKLNDDFDIARMTPEERAQAVKDWQAGAITFEEMRTALRKAGIATEDDTKAKEQIATEQVAAMTLEQPFNTPTGKAPANAPTPPAKK